MNRNDYPPNWDMISSWVRFARAQQRCECEGQCGLHRGRRCTEVHGKPARWASGKVCLTTAHYPDPTPMNVEPWNLIGACNRCHLRMDRNFRKIRYAEAGPSGIYRPGQQLRQLRLYFEAEPAMRVWPSACRLCSCELQNAGAISLPHRTLCAACLTQWFQIQESADIEKLNELRWSWAQRPIDKVDLKPWEILALLLNHYGDEPRPVTGQDVDDGEHHLVCSEFSPCCARRGDFNVDGKLASLRFDCPVNCDCHLHQ